MSECSDRTRTTLKFRLLMELNRRPKSEPADYFKLMYQSYFGLGHLVSDWNSFNNCLAQEMSEINPASKVLPLYEPITVGQPVFRLNLAPAVRMGVTPDQITETCKRFTQNFQSGDRKTFMDLITVFRSIIIEAPFDMNNATVDAFLTEYDLKQCYPVHHSDIYRRLYHPHYRLICGRLP